MSQVYSLEPPTNGKVVMRTTMGDIDIELWGKEAPRAVRNFLQLSLEGYYDNTIFHRLLKDFMIQGGDPTGTGDGGESIYGRPFKDEIHSRIKFNHRGLVACANQNAPDTNGAQFFITLDRADHLDRKASIFGKVTGDTIYNLMRFNELETGEDDRPVDPPRLLRVDVMLNPFDDIKPRVVRIDKEAAAAAELKKKAEEKKNARKGAKNFKLISFGDEAEEEEAAEVEAAANIKIKSAHDALEDEKLSKEAAVEVDLQKVREAMRAAKSAAGETEDGRGDGDFATRMRDKIAAKRAAAGTFTFKQEDAVAVPREEGEAEEKKEGSDDQAGPAHKRARLDGTGPGAKASSAFLRPSKQIQVNDRRLLTDWERKRQEYRERKRLTGHREKDTMSKLQSFLGKIRSGSTGGKNQEETGGEGRQPSAAAEGKGQMEEEFENRKSTGEAGYAGKVDDGIDHRAYMPAAWRFDTYLSSGAAGEGPERGGGGADEANEDDDDSLEALWKHRLEFKGASVQDPNARKEHIDDYVVLDPLLEKGKAKFNKEQQRRKKRETEWAGRARE